MKKVWLHYKVEVKEIEPAAGEVEETPEAPETPADTGAWPAIYYNNIKKNNE